MDSILVYDLHPTLDALLKHLHFDEDSVQAEIAEELLDEARKIAAPKTLIKELPVKLGEETIFIGDVEIKYPYVRKMLSSSTVVAAYISTCGEELEKWSQTRKGDPLEEFIADAVKLVYLYTIQKPLREAVVKDIFSDSGYLAALNPGSLEMWPISEQKKLFAMLGGECEVKEKIGVTLTDSFLMCPTKSTSGVFFLSEVEYENCELCPRLTCPNRRAKYRGE